MEKLYKPEDIAGMLKVSSQTVLNYIKEGKLKAVRLGEDRGYRISEFDLQAFLYGSKVNRTPEDYFLQLGMDKKYKSFRKTNIRPTTPLENPIPNRDLIKFLENASIRDKRGYRAYPLPGSSLESEPQERNNDGVLFKKELVFGGDLFFFTFASVWGELLTAESLWEDSSNSQYKDALGLLTSVGIMYRGLLFIRKYFPQIPYSGDVSYTFTVDNPFGRKLVMDSERPTIWFGDYRATSAGAIIIERVINPSIDSEKTKEVLLDMTKDLMWYFNCNLEDEVLKRRINEVLEIIGSE